MVALVSTSYENPVWIGWSMKRMSDSLVHDHGLAEVLFESELTLQGPISVVMEDMELAPGPPDRYRVNGASYLVFDLA